MTPKTKYARMSGAGNTFVIVDCLKKNPFEKSERASLAKKICADFHKVSSDGMIFLDLHPDFDFAWDFYNSDGSHAEMCGNASRCVSQFFNTFIEPKNEIAFLTSAGTIKAEILKAAVRVEMPEIKIEKENMQIVVDQNTIEGLWVNTGVPHFVLKGKRDKTLGQKIRSHKDFGKAGTNVTFVEKVEGEKIFAITYERGVEDFTQACGTGAVAASRFTHSHFVSMSGGDLEIQWDKNYKRAILTGDAKIDFSGEGL